MTIKSLAPEVISKIAAGEVVQRPASVVKELIENSLDAGATQITVEVRGGGKQLIRVDDNGLGIPANELDLAFQRHTTSKITSGADIQTISSLGFRGEALPSIASVADVSLVTRYADDVSGTAMKMKAGAITNKSKQGCPQGTTVTVQNLFQNVPARLKFLKSMTTESSHISFLVTQYSLAFPEVKFNLIMNDRLTLRSPGNGGLRDVSVAVYGLETAQAMLEIDETVMSESPRVAGFVSPPSLSRSNRNYLSFFVNRRWVQSRMLTYAVEEAYQGMLMSGKHPIAILDISLPPEDVDVNVHPSKSEIKFHREGDIFVGVQKAVRSTLVGHAPVPGIKTPDSQTNLSPKSIPFASPAESSAPSQPALEQGKQVAKLPILRVIGQFQNDYILAESSDGMYLVDQHAAHERVLFEKVREQQARQAIEVQGLLEPMPIELTAQQAELVVSQEESLATAGFSLEHFGERTYLLRSVPAILKQEEIGQVLTEVLDSLGGLEKSECQYNIAVSLACHGAIKSGDTQSFQEMEELLRQLEQTELPRTCPHGRSTVVYFSASQIASQFGRR